MAKKKEISQEGEEIKSFLEKRRILIGGKEVMKALKRAKINKVYLARNCPEKTRKEILYYANFNKIPVEMLTLDNQQLGSLCRKPFGISVLGVTNGENKI